MDRYPPLIIIIIKFIIINALFDMLLQLYNQVGLVILYIIKIKKYKNMDKKEINLLQKAVDMINQPTSYTKDVAELRTLNLDTNQEDIIGIMPIFKAKYSKPSHSLRIRIIFDFTSNTIQQFWGLLIDEDKIYINNDIKPLYNKLKVFIKHQLEQTDLISNYSEQQVGNDISIIINI